MSQKKKRTREVSLDPESDSTLIPRVRRNRAKRPQKFDPIDAAEERMFKQALLLSTKQCKVTSTLFFFFQ